LYAPSHVEETRLDALHALIEASARHARHARRGPGWKRTTSRSRLPHPRRQRRSARCAPTSRAPPPLWRQAGAGVLVGFHGPSDYVSPSLYAEKPVSGKVAPTYHYHYAVAHAHGVLPAAPWSVRDAPPACIETILKAIVGIEIPRGRLQEKREDEPEPPARGRGRGGGPALAPLMAAR
jgi:transcriptional regulator